MSRERVGFIGLGSMGKPMAKNLVNKGFPVTVCGHMRKEPVEELEQVGAKSVESCAEVARMSDVIITMVRDTPQTEEVILGSEGVLEGIEGGKAIVIMSTIHHKFVQDLAIRMAKANIGVLDAPVSGGPIGAEKGTLTIIVGGDKAVVERCRPTLESMGTVCHVGDIGTGLIAKLANNVLAQIQIFAATEALALGVKAGVDLHKLLEIIKTSSGNSSIIERWDYFSNVILPGYKVGEGMLYKDMKIALELAKEVGVSLPLGGLTRQLAIRSINSKSAALTFDLVASRGF